MQKTVTYIQGSCSFSQIQNIFPICRVKQEKGTLRKGEKRRGEDIKDCLIFCAIYWASTFTAIPLHHVKDCKQANNNSALETTVSVPLAEASSLPPAEKEKNVCHFCLFKLYIYIYCIEEKRAAWGFIWTIVSALAKYLWHMSFTGCGGAITVIYGETSHHGISFSKWYTAIQQWTATCAIFLSNRGHVTAERAGGGGCY